MNDSVIAIRTADGALVPVLEKGTQNRKQLVVTTAKNNQKRVHIDMYEGPADDLANSEYIGSLVIDQIDAAAAGETDIRFVAGLDERGQLKATATNLANGDSQSLSISLNEDQRGLEDEADTGDLGDLPDFSMEDEMESLESAEEAGESPAAGENELESLDDLEDELDSLEDLGDADESPGSVEDELGSIESLDEAEESGDSEVSEPLSVGDESPEVSDSFPAPEGEDSSTPSDLSDQFDEPPLFDDDFEFEDQPEQRTTQDTGFEDDELEEVPLEGAGQDDEQALGDESEGFEIETETEPAGETGFGEESFDLPEPDSSEELTSAEAQSGEEDFALPEPDTSEDAGVFQSESAASSSLRLPEEEWSHDSIEDQDGPVAKKPSVAFYIAYMILALGILAGLIYLVYGAFQGEPVPPLESGRPLLASFLPVVLGRRRVLRRSAARCGTAIAGSRNAERDI